MSAAQLAALEANAPEFGIRLIGDADAEQGIVHVVGPEQGFTLPGTTLVCGDSHTAAGARTHLLSPAMAAAAAVKGRLTDVREMMG